MVSRRANRRDSRTAGPYPSIMYGWENPPRELPGNEFLSQEDAARALGGSTLTVGRLIGERVLHPATCDGVAGVTRESLQRELENREKPFWRIKGLIRTLVTFFSF